MSETTGARAMYATILVTLDTSPTDRAIIDHVKALSRAVKTERIVLLHVADGWAARTHGSEAISPEIAEDTAYLRRVQAEFQADGFRADSALAYGDPADEIVELGRARGLRPGGHEHPRPSLPGRPVPRHDRLRVQHRVAVPVLLLRAR